MPSRFQFVDWAVLAGYFAVLAVTGWWYSRRKATGADDYFLAGRSMPTWAVAISILATTQSAATFIGAPELSYRGDLAYLSSNIGMILGALILAAVFIPAFYRHGVRTPYELLSRRFGAGAARGAAAAYLLGRILATGVRVFIGAIAASLVLFGADTPPPLIAAIAVLTIAGIFYTFIGGVRSVILTDVIQCAVYLGAAAVAAAWLISRISVPLDEVLAALRQGMPDGSSKLLVLRVGLDPSAPNLGFDPAAEFTLLTAIFGFTLLALASYGTDNDMVARMLTCKSAKQSARSLLGGILIGIPAVGLFLLLGLLLWVFYTRPDLMTGGAPAPPDATRRVFVSFILEQMPSGLVGLMMAGLFAAGLSSVNSSLNAMSSSFVNDLYRPLSPGRTEKHYLLAGRLGVIGFGCATGAFAVACVFLQRGSGQALISFALSVMTFAYAGLLGVFLGALFTRRGSAAGAIAALITGFVVVGLLQPFAWTRWTPLLPGIGEPLSKLRLNYTWNLLIGVTASFVVCCAAGRRGATIPQ